MGKGGKGGRVDDGEVVGGHRNPYMILPYIMDQLAHIDCFALL